MSASSASTAGAAVGAASACSAVAVAGTPAGATAVPAPTGMLAAGCGGGTAAAEAGGAQAPARAYPPEWSHTVLVRHVHNWRNYSAAPSNYIGTVRRRAQIRPRGSNMQPCPLGGFDDRVIPLLAGSVVQEACASSFARGQHHRVRHPLLPRAQARPCCAQNAAEAWRARWWLALCAATCRNRRARAWWPSRAAGK